MGNLRWKAPQKPNPWEGVLETKNFSHIAMQYKSTPWVQFDEDQLSEDCLYLNVWKPVNVGDKKLPVLVNIHGGGFSYGEGSEPRIEGSSMASKGMIVVTLNYRLNIFGFFAHPELSKESPHAASGNYGLLDQQFALQWVKNNIEEFGGDPNKITIAGESAGSFSVLSLISSPLSKNLIAGAIGSSGGVMPLASLQDAEKSGQIVAEKVGYATISELRTASTDAIMDFYKEGKPDAYWPIIDQYVLTKKTSEVFEAKEQAQIPLLIGWNSAELPPEVYLRGQDSSKENFVNITKELYPKHVEDILKMFPHETVAEIERSAADLAALRFVVLGGWTWFDLHTKQSNKPVYRYLFSKIHLPLLPDSIDSKNYQPPLGVGHSQELAYSWGNLALIKDYNFLEDDYKVSAIMQEYFSNFIKTGNPNGKDLPEWPEAKGNSQAPIIMNIDTDTKLMSASLDYRFKFINDEGYPYSYF